MANIKQVAEKAGVSIATVSKVLSNTPHFTEETRRKVMEAVEELGYVPNLAARALISGHSRIIAIVFPYVFDSVFTDPFVQSVLEGVERVCSQQRYNLLLSTPRLFDEGTDNNYVQLIGSGFVEGILALDNVTNSSVITPALNQKLPSVALGLDRHDNYVRNDDFYGGQVLMQHLLDLGHRHIGIIQVPEHLNYPVQERLQGLQIVAQAAGLDFSQFPIADGRFSISTGRQATAELLQNHPELTAIIALNDRMGLGAMQQAQSMGYRVPDDLSVVGYDNIPLADFGNPPLTTIDQHGPELGQRATEMLFELINGEKPESVVLKPELVIRQSTAPLKALS